VPRSHGFDHEQLRRLREGLGLTHEEFAARIGVTKQAVSSWETGRSSPSLEKLIAVVNRSGAKIERFFPVTTKAPSPGAQKSKGMSGRGRGLRRSVMSIEETGELRELRQRLKSWRKRADLTLREVSLRTGQSENYYGMIERGQRTPSDNVLEKICDVLGVSTAERDDVRDLYVRGIRADAAAKATRRLSRRGQALIGSSAAAPAPAAPPVTAEGGIVSPEPEPGEAFQALLELHKKLPRHSRRRRASDVSAHAKEYLYGRRS
jgi:transcriptional regulator with XRE-family HTH domain